ncbi:MAG TPA: hypothetical protein PLN21_08935 [Gemmatales bacterium]|nr:hypothetical protein [Gemmatales bacterium]
MRRFLFMTCLAMFGLALFPCSVVRAQDQPKRTHSNIERLQRDRLKATHEDVEALKKLRRTLPALEGLTDFRCIMHAHAEDSSHTGGTLPEMLAQAKIAGVNAILLTDHYRPPRDFIDGRWRGMKEGVLFIPGSEVRGFLIYPMKSILNRMELKTSEFVETVSVDDGLIFLSHIEERKGHLLAGLTGLEIYNRHYDAKRDMGSLIAVALKLTDPKQLAELQDLVKSYQAELFAFQNDYPTVYLDKWDEGTKTKRLTGVAANDCHHNQVMILKMLDDKTVLLGTNVDEDKGMRKITTDLRPGLKELMKDHKPGDVIARVDVDPYSISFRNSATHILARTLDEGDIRTALKAGHAYVSHDWMCDATGFQFTANDKTSKQLGVMGDEVKMTDGAKLEARLPVPALTRLLRHGKEVARAEGKADVEFELKEPGAYRLEVWLKLDGEYRPWIYANPIYVK